ncbi:hypothetical protein HY640_04075 [Candidatus Woesearchaeota archaeon]|nr:hypothetical protein [Candidatus Woesearchaeota archaeon]
MEWYDDIPVEGDLELRDSEVGELEDDELSLREAAFIEGYREAEAEDYYNDEELEEWE